MLVPKTLRLDELQQLRWEAILRVWRCRRNAVFFGTFGPSLGVDFGMCYPRKGLPQIRKKQNKTTCSKSANDDFFQVGVHNKLISFLFYSIHVPVKKRFHNCFFWWGCMVVGDVLGVTQHTFWVGHYLLLGVHSCSTRDVLPSISGT